MLERYRPGGGNRYTCPYCGQKKCFTRYVNVETGEYLDEKCGKCDHENSCPVVHYPPRDLFRDRPWLNDSDRKESEINCSASAVTTSKQSQVTAPAEYVQTEFFDLQWAEKAALRESTFSLWLKGLGYDAEYIQRVIAEYYVGATAEDIVIGGVNYGPAAVFWLVDEQQRVHDAKLIAYKADGHRVQGWGNSMRSICVKTKRGPQLEQTEKCLYGLHLVTRYPDKVVCIVESEKSALICALRYPEYVWVATGGCGNLQASKLRPLMNRRVVVYPDSGEYKKWTERMKQSGHEHYAVVDLLEAYEPNTDIADIILGVAKLKEPPAAQPSAVPTPVELTPTELAWQQMKAHNPALELLEKGLDLVPVESRNI